MGYLSNYFHVCFAMDTIQITFKSDYLLAYLPMKSGNNKPPYLVNITARLWSFLSNAE